MDLEQKVGKMKDYSKYKKIVATLCYVQNEGKTLMIHRNKDPKDIHYGKYNGLGGKAELGEDPYTCVIREVKEEAGIDIKPIYVGNLTFNDFFPGEDWEVHLFRTDGYSGGPIKPSPEGDLEWVDSDRLLELQLWPSDEVFLEHLNSGRFFFANFKYDGNKLLGHRIWFT